MSGATYAGSIAKRTLDLAGAALLLALASPLLAASAALVRLLMGAPVLYRQDRAGRGGGIFTLYKLRTMRAATGAAGSAGDETRLTTLGRALRAASLDELPQLWNVVRGDMSLVGPRPLLPEYLPRYSPEQARRHQVRPGLTGLAQISGRNALGWRDKLAHDVAYVDQCSLRLDLWILWRTALCVLRGDGISAAGHATMPEFQGDRR